MLRTALLLLLAITCLASTPFGPVQTGDRAGADLPGMPVKAAAGVECSAKCYANKTCHSWAYDTCGSQNCWLKSPKDSTLNSAAPCRQSGDITLKRNKKTFKGDHGNYEMGDRAFNDFPGGSSPAGSEQECQTRCSTTSGCTHWSFDFCGSICWLKTGTPGTIVHQDMCHFTGITAGPPGPPPAPPAPARTITNPVFGLGDPSVLKVDNWYYMTGTTGCNLQMWRSTDFSNYWNSQWKSVFQLPNNFNNCWASEMHLVDGWLYFYFNAEENGPGEHLYSLKANSQDPWGDWTYMGRATDDNMWSIDVTVWNYNNKNYMLWSGIADGVQNIFISELGSPTRMTGPAVKLHSPTPWQLVPNGGVNEGPVMLSRNNRHFLIYSGNGCWTPNYALSMVTFNGGDPLNVANWTPKDDGPVFQSGVGVFATGHNGFATDNSDTTYVVYHADDTADTHCDNKRTTRIQPLSWDANGSPLFPAAVAKGVPVRAPVI